MTSAPDLARRGLPRGVCEVATIGSPYGVENEEVGLPLYLCLDPALQLSDIWDEARHYN